jgi:hypothetical protein
MEFLLALRSTNGMGRDRLLTYERKLPLRTGFDKRTGEPVWIGYDVYTCSADPLGKDHDAYFASGPEEFSRPRGVEVAK